MLEIKRYARKRIYHGCLVRIENSSSLDHCLASLGKALWCPTVTLGQIFLICISHESFLQSRSGDGERGCSVVECRTPEREVGGSKPTAAVLCPWARHFTPRKYWLITQEAVAPSRHDWKIVDWDVKPQLKQKIRWKLQKSSSGIQEKKLCFQISVWFLILTPSVWLAWLKMSEITMKGCKSWH